MIHRMWWIRVKSFPAKSFYLINPSSIVDDKGNIKKGPAA